MQPAWGHPCGSEVNGVYAYLSLSSDGIALALLHVKCFHAPIPRTACHGVSPRTRIPVGVMTPLTCTSTPARTRNED